MTQVLKISNHYRQNGLSHCTAKTSSVRNDESSNDNTMYVNTMVLKRSITRGLDANQQIPLNLLISSYWERLLFTVDYLSILR